MKQQTKDLIQKLVRKGSYNQSEASILAKCELIEIALTNPEILASEGLSRDESNVDDDITLDNLISKWNALSEDEKFIMGKPNFTCATIAHRMKDMGFNVAAKAEEEQALVIYSMLQFYKQYGKDWINKMNAFLKNNPLPSQPKTL